MTNQQALDPAKLAQLETLDLHSGSHLSFESGHCAIELASWLANEPFNDEPVCVCPVIRAFVVNWNDALPDDETRNRLIRPLVPRLVGTRSTREVERRRAYLATDWLVRVHAPAFLALTPDMLLHAEALRSLPEIRATASAQFALQIIQAAAKASDAASAAACAAASAAAWAAASAATWAAACAAAGAAASAALKPTVEQLQESAVALIVRMVEVQA